MRQDIRERIELINNGQVPKGYTQTKFGIFPIDWEIENFKNIGNLSKGKGIPNADRSDNGYPCITYGEIYTKYNINFSQAKSFLSKDKADSSIKFDSNILIFSGSGETNLEIGKCICYTGKEDIYVGGDIVVFEPDQNKINPIFLSYQQNTTAAIKEKSKTGQGHSVVHIYKEQVGKLHCALPRLEEQEKIAEILGEWDKAIELKTSLIDKLKTQKKALMQKLLAPKPDWQQVKLGDILHEYSDRDNANLYKAVAIGKYGIRMRENIYSKELAKDISRNKVIKKDTLSIGMGSTQIDIGILLEDVKYSVSPAYSTFKIDSNFCSYFLKMFFEMHNNYLSKLYLIISARQGKSIDKKEFLKHMAFMPRLEKQQKIAEVLSMADEQIKLQQKELKQLEKQKKALMQLLLTGIVRV